MKNLSLILGFLITFNFCYSQVDTTGESYSLLKKSESSLKGHGTALRGFCDKNGNIVIPPIYVGYGPGKLESECKFYKGRVIMRKEMPINKGGGCLYGLINYKGDIIIPFMYDDIIRIGEYYICEVNVHKGLYQNRTKQEMKLYYKMDFVNNYGWILFNRNGKVLLNKLIRGENDRYESYKINPMIKESTCSNFQITTIDEENIFLSSECKILLNNIKSSNYDFNSNIKINTLDNKFGLLDSCLSFILKPKYENIVVLENKGFLVLEKESEITNKTENFTYKTTFFDKKMNIIKIFGDSIKNIECLYTSHTTIRDSKLIMLFQFYNGKKWGIMNTSGEIILPAKFDSFEYSEQKIVGRERYSYTKFFTLDGKEIE